MAQDRYQPAAAEDEPGEMFEIRTLCDDGRMVRGEHVVVVRAAESLNCGCVRLVAQRPNSDHGMHVHAAARCGIGHPGDQFEVVELALDSRAAR